MNAMWQEIDARQTDEGILRWEIDLVAGVHRVVLNAHDETEHTLGDGVDATTARNLYDHPFVGWKR